MTKLTEMDLGTVKSPMIFCEICRVLVPQIDKHNKKRHKQQEKK